MRTALLIGLLSFSAFAFANPNDGSDLPACKGVTDVCMKANVTFHDAKRNKDVTGYQYGEHQGDGHGLWIDCVDKIAKGGTADGVTGVSKQAAQACLDAEKAAHPHKK
jgi:hypothetical protein